MEKLNKLFDKLNEPDPVGFVYTHKKWLVKFEINGHTFQKELNYRKPEYAQMGRCYDKNEIIEFAKSLKRKNTQVALSTTTIERIL